MGGRGTSSGIERGATGGVGSVDVRSTTSLISQREDGKQEEVDIVLSMLREVQEQYGTELNDIQVATLTGDSVSAIAYYDSNSNLAVNKIYFDNAKITQAYDDCIASGFHPARGFHSAMEAVVAHELGHHLTELIGLREGLGAWQIDRVANGLVNTAMTNLGYRSTDRVRSGISGYAKQNNAEAVAEAYADVYCNGDNAARESRAIVTELNRRLGR